MTIQRSAQCPTCGKQITLNRDGMFRPHGHPARRCVESGNYPRWGAEIMQTERTYAEMYGACSHCGSTKRLKKDGTVFRHFDACVPVRVQQGWCPGSDELPKEAGA